MKVTLVNVVLATLTVSAGLVSGLPDGSYKSDGRGKSPPRSPYLLIKSAYSSCGNRYSSSELHCCRYYSGKGHDEKEKRSYYGGNGEGGHYGGKGDGGDHGGEGEGGHHGGKGDGGHYGGKGDGGHHGGEGEGGHHGGEGEGEGGHHGGEGEGGHHGGEGEGEGGHYGGKGKGGYYGGKGEGGHHGGEDDEGHGEKDKRSNSYRKVKSHDGYEWNLYCSPISCNRSR